MRIETELLYLREMTAADYDALYDVLADSDIMQHYTRLTRRGCAAG